MKVVGLRFITALHVGQDKKAIGLDTHDIEQLGPGYLVTHRASGKSYHLHGSLVVAEVELPEGDAPVATEDKPRKGKAAA